LLAKLSTNLFDLRYGKNLSSPQKVKVPVMPGGQFLIIGLSKLARLKSFDNNQGEISLRDQEKSFLFRAVEVM
jgi:hypothetical protein